MPATRTEWKDGIELAFELTKRHPELLKDVPPMSDILFVLDTEATPKSKGNSVMARVSKIAGKFTDFVYDGNKTWIYEHFQANCSHLTRNQRYVLMVHELLHFELDGDMQPRLRGHDIEEFFTIADHPKIGLHWADETHGDVLDIMASDFEWGKEGQARLKLDEEDTLHAARVAALQQKIQKAKTQIDELEAIVNANGQDVADRKADGELVGLAVDMVKEFGLEGAQAIVSMIQEEQAKEWQPEAPLVTKDNVVQFPGTHTASSGS